MKQSLAEYFVKQGYAKKISDINIELLDKEKSHNHLNYKVVVENKIFVARVTTPDNVLSYTNLSDEYTLLKLIEKYDIGPKVLRIDLEGFDTPLLIEEYFDGIPFHDAKQLGEHELSNTIDLIVGTSEIELTPDTYPFKFSYTTYETNFKTWQQRLEEIASVLGAEHTVVKELKLLTKKGQETLTPQDGMLRDSKVEFIYNDIHPGNTFLLKNGQVRFIDWQKVSFGDPSFMLALFAKRFGKLWNLGQEEFTEKILNLYMNKKETSATFTELMHTRILERTISDAIWVVWAEIKKGHAEVSLDMNNHFKEAKKLLSECSRYLQSENYTLGH